MQNNVSTFRLALTFGIPLLLLGFLILITQNIVLNSQNEMLSMAITGDLLVTIPLIYFLCIRKTEIPKTTVVPFIILGLIIGYYILPKDQQQYLGLFKTWILPIIEISIAVYVFLTVRKSIKTYKNKKDTSTDFFTVLLQTCATIVPKKIAPFLASEIAIFYYGLFTWRKKTPKAHEFTYHKNSSSISLLIALLLIIGIETYVIHFLVLKWSTIAAWIVSIISVYSGMQIFGFLKSMMHRFYSVEHNHLYLRCGIMSDAKIPLENIESIELTSKELDPKGNIKNLSPLGSIESHNMIVHLHEPIIMTQFYGIKRSCKAIAFFADTPKALKDYVLASDMKIT